MHPNFPPAPRESLFLGERQRQACFSFVYFLCPRCKQLLTLAGGASVIWGRGGRKEVAQCPFTLPSVVVWLSCSLQRIRCRDWAAGIPGQRRLELPDSCWDPQGHQFTLGQTLAGRGRGNPATAALPAENWLVRGH